MNDISDNINAILAAAASKDKTDKMQYRSLDLKKCADMLKKKLFAGI